MFHFYKAFEDQVQFLLHTVHYEKIPLSPTPVSYQVNTYDQINIVSKNEDAVTIHFLRNVFFEPAGIFNIAVVFETIWKPKDWALISSVSDEQIISSMLAEKKEFVGSIASRESLLISSITASFGLTPLITPPEFDIGNG